MARNTGDEPDIRVLVGTVGDASIDEGSGGIIADNLRQIAKNISNSDKHRPKIIVSLDIDKTATKVQEQLNNIIKAVKVEPISLNVRTTQPSMGSFAEDELRKVIESTKGKKSKVNIIAYAQEKVALGELVVQREKDAEAKKRQTEETKKYAEAVKQLSFLGSAEQSTKYNGILNNVDKLGLTDLANEFKVVEQYGNDLCVTLNNLMGDISKMPAEDAVKKFSEVADSEQMKKLLNDTREYYVEFQRIETLSKKDSATFVKESRHAKDAKDLENLITAMKKYEQTNDKFKNNSGVATQFEGIAGAAKALKASGAFSGVDVDILRQKFVALQGQITDMGLTGQTAFGKLRTQMEKLGVYMSASAILMGVVSQLKQMTQNVIELDNALNSLQMVTGYSNSQMQELLKTYQSLASELSATTSEVLAGSEVWLRQGRSISETNELIKTSTVFSKVAMIDATEASDLLTSSINGYGVAAKDAMSIVDALSAVDMSAATSSQEMAQAMQKTAASAKLAGVPMSELIAYIATISETSRASAEVVGTAMKSLFSRITQVKAGKLVDDDGEDISNVSKVLAQYGVAVQNTNGTLRDANVIISDLANTWEELTNAEQQEVAGAVAGLRQKEQFTILMENWSRVTDLATVATNSNGYALDKFNIHQKSTAAKMAEFQNQFQILSATIIDSDLIKGTIDTGAGFLGALTWIIENLGSIPTLATVAAGAISALSNKGGLVKNSVTTQYICVESQRTYALCNLVETLNELPMSDKRLHNKSLKWCA